MSRRRKQRQSLAGSKWRVMGSLEKGIVQRLRAAFVKYEEKEENFLFSVTDMPCISVRQKWYLAFIASKNAKQCNFDERETEWINDVLSQDCPEGFVQKKPYWEKPQAVPPVLLGAKRKIRE